MRAGDHLRPPRPAPSLDLPLAIVDMPPYPFARPPLGKRRLSKHTRVNEGEARPGIWESRLDQRRCLSNKRATTLSVCMPYAWFGLS
jgi:hypothetical protein